MEFTGIQKFNARNGKLNNFKDCEGMLVRPIGFDTSTYTGQDGKEHQKLVILNGLDGEMYKTEVKAFIEKFLTYDESFGDMKDEEKPLMVIVIRKSKAGNNYVNFELQEETAAE